jgi:PAS domain-containing protein
LNREPQNTVKTPDPLSLFKVVLEHASDNMVLLDKNYRVLYFNDLTRQTFMHLRGREIKVGDDFRGFVLHSMMDTFLQSFDKAIRTTAVEMELHSRHPHTDMWFRFRFRPFFDADGEPAGVIMAAANIDARTKAEKELEKKNHELLLLNAVSDRILESQSADALWNNLLDELVHSGNYHSCRVAGFIPGDPGGQVVYRYTAVGDGQEFPFVQLAARERDTLSDCLLKQETTVARMGATTLGEAGENIIRSAIFLPLATPVGIVACCIYSVSENAFDEGEKKNLQRICRNISQALKNLYAADEKRKVESDLKERMKELRTLYYAGSVLQRSRSDFENALAEIVTILPDGWQYPGICAARIEFDGKAYSTANYGKAAGSLAALFKTFDQKTGTIEVIYLDKRPAEFEGPFLEEERKLIDNLAGMIAQAYNENAGFEALRKSEASVKSIFNNTEIGYVLLNLEYEVITFNKPFSDEFALLNKIDVVEGDSFISKIAKDRAAAVLQHLETATRKQTVVSYEITYEAPEREHRSYSVTVFPVKDDAQNLVGVCIAAQDISLRRDQEIKLEEKRLKLIESVRQVEEEHKYALAFQSQLLSSQLNPHFIYNTLSSFQYYILEGEVEKFLLHISDFSKLMRQVLENSTHKFIPLDEEIEFLDHYIRMSKKRMTRELEHSILIDEDLDYSEIFIPPMLLQPYVENALIHGLPDSDRDPVLEIRIECDDEVVRCLVRDNGVGRKRSGQKTGLGKKSYAMGINQRRIEILNEFTENNFEVEVRDLLGEAGEPAGTEVAISYRMLDFNE